MPDKFGISLQYLRQLEEYHNKLIFFLEDNDSISKEEWEEISRLDDKIIRSIYNIKYELT